MLVRLKLKDDERNGTYWIKEIHDLGDMIRTVGTNGVPWNIEKDKYLQIRVVYFGSFAKWMVKSKFKRKLIEKFGGRKLN